MVEYNIVKHCLRCKKRFVVGKALARVRFCKECQEKMKDTQE